uniref:Putative mucin-like peritrophin n=1 Tax=Corethrella appendiculata TaxID=1370023 RepID=U5EPX5_9DIPT
MKFFSAIIVTLSCVSFTLAVECPTGSDPESPVLLADPEDCSKYFICDGLTPVSSSCPVGLEWNDGAKYCDFPDNAKCNVKPPTSTSTSTISTTSAPVPTSTQTHTIPSSSSTTTNVPEMDETCPEVFDILHPTFFSDASDCRNYFVCVSTLMVRQTCPDDLYWNAEGNFCSRMQQERCKA